MSGAKSQASPPMFLARPGRVGAHGAVSGWSHLGPVFELMFIPFMPSPCQHLENLPTENQLTRHLHPHHPVRSLATTVLEIHLG